MIGASEHGDSTACMRPDAVSVGEASALFLVRFVCASSTKSRFLRFDRVRLRNGNRFFARFLCRWTYTYTQEKKINRADPPPEAPHALLDA